MTILRVALDVPVDETFDYRGEEAHRQEIGRLLVVPFGSRQRVGVLVGVTETTAVPAAKLRAPVRVLMHLPPVPADILDLLTFCSRYYHHPLGPTVLGCLPTALRRTTALPVTRSLWYRLTAAGRQIATEGLPRRLSKQQALLEELQRAGALSLDALRQSPSGRRFLTRWLADGWVEAVPAEDVPAVAASSVHAPVGAVPTLNAGQYDALASIRAHGPGFATHLLHGITGSGKTEVYLQLMADQAAKGRQSLLLVPEINLTPQLQARVAERFGRDRVVALHSGLSEGERLQRWLRAVSGEASVVLGTRLAVFTPMPGLGLIVVDEEHDPSFKQQEGLRYHARDVAVFRARQAGVPVVLGSATPSLETWRHAADGKYRLLRLPERAVASAVPPVLRLVDTRAMAGHEALSPSVLTAIETRLSRGEQSLVFLNRRGYAPTLYCHACGWVAPCHRCSARLTVHLASRRLRCHYCGHDERVPTQCPSCGNQDLLPVGQGTQRIEAALAERFPAARIARVDRDTTRNKDAFDQLRERVTHDELDILVGTQMLAKGHDFPRLTLVAVLGIDAALFAPDFRAEERLFSLMLQVIGRAGRADLPGEALIQTTLPTHPFFTELMSQDYAAFADRQLRVREQSGFPPYSHQALLRAEGNDEHPVFEFLREAAGAARAMQLPVIVHDPVPAWIARLAGRWRGQVLMQSEARSPLQALLRDWTRGLTSTRVRWSIDVDPNEL